MKNPSRRDTFRAGLAAFVLKLLGVGPAAAHAALGDTIDLKGDADVTNLYGKNWKADDLASYLGQMAQVAGVTPFEYSDGRAKGLRAARVYTGSGFDFTVALDRAMDIPLASYNGMTLNWLSQVGVVAPEYYEPAAKGWDRTFSGGLLQTCGLRCAGHDSVDDGEAFGLHGRISTTPAENVQITTEWQGDKYVLALKATMREAHAYGENVILTRTITTEAGSSSFTLRDEVLNDAYRSTPHAIMYHINPGFPVLSEDSKILWSLEKVEGTTEADFVKFGPPSSNLSGGGYFYHKSDSDGRAKVALVNPKINSSQGLGVYIAYDNSALPCMITWKEMHRHVYVVAIEPANCRVSTNKKLSEQGILPILEPGEKRTCEIEFGVLSSASEIEKFRASLP